MKRISLLLCLAMLFSIVACAEKQSGTDNVGTTAAIEETTEAETELSDDLQAYDWEGRVFTVMCRDEDEHYREVTADEMTGDIINDSIYERNSSVSERFNASVDTYLVAEGSLNAAFNAAVSAGDRSFDLAMQHMIYTASLAANGVTLNWYDMPNINYEKPWWTSSVRELSVNNIMYITVSDYCLNTFEMAWVLVFNKAMMSDLGLTDPYQSVHDGKWTIDAYYDLVKDVSSDSNGDGKMTVDDTYGINSYGSPWLASISNYWWACGEQISRFDEKGEPYFAMDNEKTYLIFDKMYKLLCENDISYWDKTNGKDLIFWKNQSLFASMMVRDVEVNRDKDIEYGLVPYPKYDAEQEGYLTLVDGHASVMCIPVTLNEDDKEFVSYMIEALSCETYKSVLPAYYEIAMQIKFAQDEEFPYMLDLVRTGRVFNFGYVYDIAINRDVLVNLITSKKTDLASSIAKQIEPTANYYAKIMAIYGE